MKLTCPGADPDVVLPAGLEEDQVPCWRRYLSTGRPRLAWDSVVQGRVEAQHLAVGELVKAEQSRPARLVPPMR